MWEGPIEERIEELKKKLQAFEAKAEKERLALEGKKENKKPEVDPTTQANGETEELKDSEMRAGETSKE